jgi:hypothetical protein
MSDKSPYGFLLKRPSVQQWFSAHGLTLDPLQMSDGLPECQVRGFVFQVIQQAVNIDGLFGNQHLDAPQSLFKRPVINQLAGRLSRGHHQVILSAPAEVAADVKW